MKVKALLVRVGSISSVLDMMRYDKCYPATEADSGRLEMSRPDSRDRSFGEHLVIFMAHSPAAPTIGRWASFGCEVIDSGSYASMQMRRENIVEEHEKVTGKKEPNRGLRG